jgi:putative flippase GtrA
MENNLNPEIKSNQPDFSETKKFPNSKKDYIFSILAGIFIGFLALPILKAAKPDLFEKYAMMVVPAFFFIVPFGLLIAHYLGRKISVIWQLAKFVVIGVLNTLFDLGVLSVLIFIFRAYFKIESTDIFLLGITFYSVYKGTSFIAANINSYYWNKYWTFEQTAQKKTALEFIQFFVVSIIGFAINVLVASYVFKNVSPLAGFNPDQWGLIGAMAGSVMGLAWNFIGYKFIVFKK